MDIRVLQYFLAVAREESITKAAEALRMTQPPLSRQLKDLEEELGKQLRSIARDAAEQHHPHDGETSGKPPPSSQQTGEHTGQKGQVHPGYRHCMTQSYPL